jgi:hypothetical protein
MPAKGKDSFILIVGEGQAAAMDFPACWGEYRN